MSGVKFEAEKDATYALSLSLILGEFLADAAKLIMDVCKGAFIFAINFFLIIILIHYIQKSNLKHLHWPLFLIITSNRSSTIRSFKFKFYWLYLFFFICFLFKSCFTFNLLLIFTFCIIKLFLNLRGFFLNLIIFIIFYIFINF